MNFKDTLNKYSKAFVKTRINDFGDFLYLEKYFDIVNSSIDDSVYQSAEKKVDSKYKNINNEKRFIDLYEKCIMPLSNMGAICLLGDELSNLIYVTSKEFNMFEFLNDTIEKRFIWMDEREKLYNKMMSIYDSHKNIDSVLVGKDFDSLLSMEEALKILDNKLKFFNENLNSINKIQCLLISEIIVNCALLLNHPKTNTIINRVYKAKLSNSLLSMFNNEKNKSIIIDVIINKTPKSFKIKSLQNMLENTNLKEFDLISTMLCNSTGEADVRTHFRNLVFDCKLIKSNSVVKINDEEYKKLQQIDVPTIVNFFDENNNIVNYNTFSNTKMLGSGKYQDFLIVYYDELVKSRMFENLINNYNKNGKELLVLNSKELDDTKRVIRNNNLSNKFVLKKCNQNINAFEI